MVPDYISEKIMKQNKINQYGNGDCYGCMGCRSFLTPDRIKGNPAKALDYVEDKAKKAGDEIKEKYGSDTTYLSFLASGGQFFVFDGAGFGSVLYEDMGLKKPEGMPEQTDISLPVVTYEGLASIKSDYIFLIAIILQILILVSPKIYDAIPAKTISILKKRHEIKKEKKKNKKNNKQYLIIITHQ